MTQARTYPRRGLHGAVVHDIGVRILRGELQPGDLLTLEEELGGESSISRTVVREAIKVLAAKRLVESRPKTGTRVRPRRDWNFLDPDVLAWTVEAGPDDHFLEQALEVRGLIEPHVVRLAAERATDEQIAQLEQAHCDLEQAGEGLEAFMEPDLRFHTLLFEASHNELLEQMASILTAMLRAIFAYSGRPGAFGRSARRHGSVVKAIRKHDPDAAEAALLKLIEETRASVDWARSHAPD